MKITNNYNMPAVLEEYCRNKFEQEVAVTRSSIGVTALIDSAWKAHLTRKHWDDLVVDCRDVWFAFQGEYKHMVLDNVRLWNSLTGRMLLPIRSPQGEIALKGIPDLITPFTIEDHKTCSVSAIWYMEKDKHVEQLNLYRYLVEGVFGMAINKLVLEGSLDIEPLLQEAEPIENSLKEMYERAGKEDELRKVTAPGMYG